MDYPFLGHALLVSWCYFQNTFSGASYLFCS